jgi:ABC-type glycerol-3-phosphate transport system substrate-binding protein
MKDVFKSTVVMIFLAALVLLGDAALRGWNGARRRDNRTVVTFWYTSGKFPLEKLIRDFNASQDSIYIEGAYQGGYIEILQKLLLSIVTNSTPVIAQVEVSMAVELVDYDAVISLSRFFEDGYLDVEDFIPPIMASAVYGDSIYAIPTNISEPLLYLNRDLLAMAGYDRSYVPKTWQELREAARKVAALGDNYFGFDISMGDWHIETYIWQWGGRILGEDGQSVTFNSPESLAMLTFMVDMIQEGSAVRSAGDVEKFLSGRAAFAVKSSAAFRNFLKYTNFDLDVAPVPAGPGGRTIPSGGANVYFFKNHPEEQYRAAMTFIKYLLGLHQQIYWSMETGYMVSLWSTVNSDTMQQIFAQDPRRWVPYEAVMYSIPRPRWGPYKAINADMIRMFNAALQGLCSPKEALDEAERMARRKMDRYYY